MKAKRKLPIVLTQEEVMSMINVVENIFWKALIMLMYSTGLRQGEVRKLKKGDIDSKRMVIHVRDGKGGKGRQALLSPKVLKCLRQYWRERRLNNPVESDYLFIPTKNSHSGKLAKKLSHTAVGYIVARVAKLAGIKKKFTHIFCVTPLQLIF